jgi:hypothetical protein
MTLTTVYSAEAKTHTSIRHHGVCLITHCNNFTFTHPLHPTCKWEQYLNWHTGWQGHCIRNGSALAYLVKCVSVCQDFPVLTDIYLLWSKLYNILLFFTKVKIHFISISINTNCIKMFQVNLRKSNKKLCSSCSHRVLYSRGGDHQCGLMYSTTERV